MDLSTIRDKVRRMEYKDREDFRHDVFQITFNAHAYNDGRNPAISPLADQLLELCDYLLDENHEILAEAEAGHKLDLVSNKYHLRPAYLSLAGRAAIV
ncbi:hypothetical protein Q3G72_024570 [Acer saccharum]|nr:hypothetical protein Q3G72_024570 [Acer saccharum]